MHRVLDVKISDHEKNHLSTEHTQVTEWKKQKLKLRDEISRLERLQWEYTHETIDYDDR